MNRTKIEWCDYTWNPIVGCTRGCPYCYARRQAKRFKHRCEKCYNFIPHIHPERMDEPMQVKKPARIFACSMGELFDPCIPKADKMMVIEAMKDAEHHTFIVLTKRPHEMILDEYHRVMPNNVWLGVSAEGDENLWRLDYLREYEGVRVLSLEPLLGRFDRWRYFGDADWIIVGAETGNRKGKVVPKSGWIRDIVYVARKMDIPIFMKDNLKPYYNGELIQEFPEVE